MSQNVLLGSVLHISTHTHTHIHPSVHLHHVRLHNRHLRARLNKKNKLNGFNNHTPLKRAMCNIIVLYIVLDNTQSSSTKVNSLRLRITKKKNMHKNPLLPQKEPVENHQTAPTPFAHTNIYSAETMHLYICKPENMNMDAAPPPRSRAFVSTKRYVYLT